MIEIVDLPNSLSKEYFEDKIAHFHSNWLAVLRTAAQPSGKALCGAKVKGIIIHNLGEYINCGNCMRLARGNNQ